MSIKEFAECCMQLRSLMSFRTTTQSSCLCCGIEPHIVKQVEIVMKNYFGEQATVSDLSLVTAKAQELFTSLTEKQSWELVQGLIFA